MTGSGFAFPHLYMSVPDLSAPSGAGLSAAGWSDALFRERGLRTDRPVVRHPLRSLLVGGEAPEVLGPELPDRIRRVIGREALAGIEEWTVEVSDPRVEASTVSAWISGGVTRLSLRGAAADPASVARIADLCVGRAMLGVDLSLASVEAREIRSRIQELVGLGVGSLAFVEPDLDGDEDTGSVDAGVQAPAASTRDADRSRHPERYREAWLTAVDGVRRAGWRFLDLAFAFGTASCPRHPRAIARRNPVLGLGPGAVTFRHPSRRWNQADFRSYLGAMDDTTDPVAGRERLTLTEARLERCWHALRTARGVRLAAPSCVSTPWFERWRDANWIQTERETSDAAPRRMRLTPEGWLVSDGLAVQLAMALSGRHPGNFPRDVP